MEPSSPLSSFLSLPSFSPSPSPFTHTHTGSVGGGGVWCHQSRLDPRSRSPASRDSVSEGPPPPLSFLFFFLFPGDLNGWAVNRFNSEMSGKSHSWTLACASSARLVCNTIFFSSYFDSTPGGVCSLKILCYKTYSQSLKAQRKVSILLAMLTLLANWVNSSKTCPRSQLLKKYYSRISKIKYTLRTLLPLVMLAR